jgi:hypothetical protein
MSSDIQETADGLNNQVRADRETEVGEIGGAGRTTSNNRQRRGAEIHRIEGRPKSKDMASAGWSVLPSVIGDSSDIDSSSLRESVFSLRAWCPSSQGSSMEKLIKTE